MTPAARIATAAELLDRIAAGEAAEQVLTNWARASRFAGSGDRAALRDLVFDALRRRRSLAARAGAPEPATGRQLMIGALLTAGTDTETVFTGVGYAPAPLTAAERADLARAADAPISEAQAHDCPDWLVAPLRASLGPAFGPSLRAMRNRAPVFLRVNTGRATVGAARSALAADNIRTSPHPLAETALLVTVGAAGLRRSKAYAEGLVEVQDAASQAASEAIPITPGDRVLDYCAGGGGKTLALAARVAGAPRQSRFVAHDAAPHRMADLPARAARAGVTVVLADAAAARRGAPYDLVVVDAPCTGSGTWARNPEAKWGLTPGRLAGFAGQQDEILAQAAPLVATGGHLAYMTCSLLDIENGDRIEAFGARSAAWHLRRQRLFTPSEGGDGFFLAVLQRLTDG